MGRDTSEDMSERIPVHGRIPPPAAELCLASRLSPAGVWLVGGVIENHSDYALTYLGGVLARVRLL